jgi:tyrosine-protein kinase Etk/Wzc
MLGPLQLIARIPTRVRHRNDETALAAPVFDVLGGRSDVAYTEAFRALRTNLYRALPGEHGKVLMVTSPESDDGKTTCALSLAAMLAADNRRVLVIDADVRKPTHHRLFGIPGAPGLGQIVAGAQHRWREVIRTLCLSSGSFDALCAGDAPPAELLSDPQFAAFLINARSQYDFVVLDAPSYPAVSDPLLLAPLADFVLSVVRLGSTSRRAAEEHLSGMFNVTRAHGVAVNNVEIATQGHKPQSMVPRLAGALRRLR